LSKERGEMKKVWKSTVDRDSAGGIVVVDTEEKVKKHMKCMMMGMEKMSHKYRCE